MKFFNKKTILANQKTGNSPLGYEPIVWPIITASGARNEFLKEAEARRPQDEKYLADRIDYVFNDIMKSIHANIFDGYIRYTIDGELPIEVIEKIKKMGYITYNFKQSSNMNNYYSNIDIVWHFDSYKHLPPCPTEEDVKISLNDIIKAFEKLLNKS